MDYIKITCKKCSFAQEIVEQVRFYLFSNMEIPVYSQLAWCHSCACIVEAEKLLKISEIDKQILEIKSKVINTNRDLENSEKILKIFSDKIACLQNTKKWRKKRKSPSKCLECGSTSFIIISDKEGGIHPCCGGKLDFSILDMCLINTGGIIYHSSEGEVINQPD